MVQSIHCRHFYIVYSEVNTILKCFFMWTNILLTIVHKKMENTKKIGKKSNGIQRLKN